jgi:hypothetical protein
MEVLSDILLAVGIVLVFIAKIRIRSDEAARSRTEILLGVGVAFITFALVDLIPGFVQWFMSGWNAFH